MKIFVQKNKKSSHVSASKHKKLAKFKIANNSLAIFFKTHNFESIYLKKKKILNNFHIFIEKKLVERQQIQMILITAKKV